MNGYEIQHRMRSNRFLMLVLALHIPVLTLLAAFGLGSVVVALVGSAMICVVPALLTYSSPQSQLTSVSIASSMMGMSALLIYLSDGKIEAHFHVFSFLAVLSYMASIWGLVTAAATIAVHHVVGWLMVPRAVYNYDVGFGDVAVHAGFVVIETIICCLIAHEFAKTIRMRGVLEEEVSRTAEQVAVGSREIASFVENFVRSASTQAAMVDQISDASQSMKSKLTENLHVAQDNEKQIVKTVEEIAETHARLGQINQQMQTVSATSRKISGIVNLMMDIARQTNILAVNASIEASRSGNSGGGFGVIADQVRDLAVRTSEATTEIDSLISNSVQLVETSAHGIESVTSQFAQLNQATQQMKTLLASINDLGRHQAGSIEQISQSMLRIAAETQNFASAAEETAGTSAQMRDLAGELRHTLSGLSQ